MEGKWAGTPLEEPETATDACSVLPFPRVAASVAKEDDVERINQFELYGMGRAFEKLRKDVPPDPADIFLDLLEARGMLVHLEQGKPIPIGVSEAKAHEFHNAIDLILNKYFYVPADQGLGTKFQF